MRKAGNAETDTPQLAVPQVRWTISRLLLCVFQMQCVFQTNLIIRFLTLSGGGSPASETAASTDQGCESVEATIACITEAGTRAGTTGTGVAQEGRVQFTTTNSGRSACTGTVTLSIHML